MTDPTALPPARPPWARRPADPATDPTPSAADRLRTTVLVPHSAGYSTHYHRTEAGRQACQAALEATRYWRKAEAERYFDRRI